MRDLVRCFYFFLLPFFSWSSGGFMWLGLGIKDDFFLHINFAKIGYCNVNFEPFFFKKKIWLEKLSFCVFVSARLHAYVGDVFDKMGA